MPVLEGLNKKYVGKNFAIVGLLLDPNREKWARQIVKEADVTFPNLKDDGRFGQHIFGVPQAILVDGSGRILDILVGNLSSDQFSEIIEKNMYKNP